MAPSVREGGTGAGSAIAELETAASLDLNSTSIDLQPPKRLTARSSLLGCYGVFRPSRVEGAGWSHMPHDILVAIVRRADPADVRSAHRVCRAWHHAVRCGTTALAPSAKHCSFPRLRECFPRVTTLHLHHFSLSPREAMQLASLTRLKALELNGVVFETCSSVGMLTALTGLRALEMCDVTAGPPEMDAFLRSLTGLTRLHVCHTVPSLKMPPMHCLSEMRLLQELTLSESLHYVVPGLASISALQRLQALSLMKVGVTNAVLRAAGALPALRSLHIPDAFRVTDAGVAFLSALTGLTHLDMCSPGDRRDELLSDAGASALAPLTRLRSLTLAGHAQLTPEGLGFLSECTALSALDLAEMPCLRLGTGFLGPLEGLQRLSLEACALGHTQLLVLAQLTHLTALNLAWCGVTDKTAGALTSLTRMECLDMRFSPLTNAGVLRLSAAMPNLARCVIDGCPVTSLGVWRLLAGHRRLRLWSPGRDGLHRAMNVADALLLCCAAPGQRRLRVALHPEASWPLTAAVSAGVASFFVLYFGLLLLFFTALFMFPIFMLGCICVALCAAVVGARYAVRNLRKLWCRCDFAFSTFLLGHHAQPHGQQQQHDQLPV